MDQAQKEFLVEIEGLVEQIYVDLDALRGAGSEGRVRRELIDRVFRRIHSVKGLAATGGLQVLSQIAHAFENLLDAARAGRIDLAEAVLDTCESATDALSESLRLAASGIVEPPRRDLFERLQAATHGAVRGSNDDDEAIIERIPLELSQALTQAERYQLASAVREGGSLFTISASFDIARFAEEFVRVKEKLAKWGEVITTSPAVDDSHPDKINFRLLYASSVDVRNLEANLGEFLDVVLKPLESVGTPDSPKSEEQSSSVSPSVSSLANFVRTDLDTLDRLISSTHQLFRKTSHALDAATNAKAKVPKEEMARLNDEIKASFLGVEDELINLRMVSLGPTLQRTARAGKAAARVAGKEVNFEVTGSDLQLDKLLADALGDPLIHLIRNAVDHGIEDADTRAHAGKNRRGTIRIEAINDGGRSRVKVSDDGRGINPDLISAAAKRLGIHESETDLDFERSLRLIFRPGFTTVDSVSDLSGRGVGLDVVETVIEQSGGELRVSSKPGVGTTFEIRLPVTFGLMEARVVVSGGNRYCIAASQIITSDETVDSGARTGTSNSEQLPEVSMRDLLGQSYVKQTVSLRSDASKTPELKHSSTHQAHLIICNIADEQGGTISTRRVGIVVDGIGGTEKILVRGLGRHAGRWYGIAGATELGDGSIALVLDLPRLLSGYLP
ncbi:MAG: ATP-binding protein [Acidobacteriota bacterium]